MIIVIIVNLKNTKIQQSENYVAKWTLSQIEHMSAEFESPIVVIIDKTIKDIIKESVVYCFYKITASYEFTGTINHRFLTNQNARTILVIL